MDKATIISLIRNRMGFNTAMQESVILDHMDLMQASYETGDDSSPLPWFLFNSSATVATVADTRTVALPSAFICFDDDWPLRS